MASSTAAAAATVVGVILFASVVGVAAMTNRPCLICGLAHHTRHHAESFYYVEPPLDLDVAAIACIVIGALGLLGSLLTAIIPH